MSTPPSSSSPSTARASGSTTCRGRSSRTATSKGLVARGRRRRHVEPDDLPGRDRRGRRLRRPDPRGLERRARRAEGDLPRARRATTSATPATSCKPVWDDGDGKDGWVSLEVDPNLAHDTEGTIDEAKRLHALVDRPNLFIKIPATVEGLPAIEETIAAGIPVNVTLIFSLERHREVAEAYVRGLKRLRRRRRRPVASIASVASFFVSRVDTEADKRLDEIGGHDELKGKLAIANAKLAYQTYKEVFSGDRSGRRWRPRAPPRSAACGRRPRPRTPTTAT